VRLGPGALIRSPRVRTLVVSAVATVVAFVAAASAGARAESRVRVAFLQGEQVVYVERAGSGVRAAVAALLAGPNAAERQRRITTQVPRGSNLRSATLVGGVATVDLAEAFALGLDAESLSARLAQLVLTATGAPRVRAVRVRIKGGTPLGLFPGVDLTRPVTAKDITAPDLPPPAQGGGGGPPTPGTADVQRRLAELGYLDPALISGQYDARTRYAVMAFQKWEGLGRDGIVGPQTTARLAIAQRPTPRTSGTGVRVEVLLDRQVALVIDGVTVIRTLAVSSGRPGYQTSAGSFRVTRKEQRSWSVPYKVWLPWASYFVGGVAFHEYADVPASPASHGCVRVPEGDAAWLYSRLSVGTPVTVLARST
jgi:hypothetical protein